MNNIDIVFSEKKEDFKVDNTDKYKGQNICQVQLGELNGGKSIGIDFNQFVKGELEFSMETFKAHILNQLTVLNCQVKRIEVKQNDLDGTITIGVR